jgi:hypothetical protein
MKTLRRFLATATLVVTATGLANATSIGSVDTQGVVTFTTDGTYTLTLPDFDSTLGTLTGATLYFYGKEDISTLTLTNTALTAQVFDVAIQSNLNQNSNNTANSADKYSGETLDIFDTGIGPTKAQYPTTPGSLTLGTTGTCPEYTPSASCGSVAYTPGDIIVQNIDAVYGLTSGTGPEGVDGVIETISGADLCNYEIGCAGLGTFSLTGATKSLLTLSGGGNNINFNVNTTASFEAEVDYTYSLPSGTPEPATMALMGGALIGLGLIGKRLKKS